MSTVVAQPYSTAGNGGRKLVRLSNGWLVAATTQANGVLRIFKSIDNGETWTENGSNPSFGSIQDVAIEAIPGTTKVAFLVAYQGAYIVCQVYDVANWSLSSNKSIEPMQNSVGNVSITTDPSNGHLHAAWASKNTSYSNSFNIRYAKSTDGGATWGTVEQLTKLNNPSVHTKNPSIVVRNGEAIITSDFNNAGSYYIYAFGATLPTTDTFAGSFNLGAKRVYDGGTYAQSNPSAVVDKDGVIHVAWRGYYAGNTQANVLYSSSADGGVTWSAMEKLTSIASYGDRGNPSVTVDRTNTLFVIFPDNETVNYPLKQIKKTNGVWGAISTISPSGYDPSTLYDVTFSGSFGSTPPTIYRNIQANTVDYIGTYTTNQAPAVNLTTPSNNQTLYENDTFNIAGTALDVDIGNTVTVRYQINATTTRAIKAFLSDGSTLESFSKALTFKGGNLYDGTTLIAENLSDGVAHTLKIWATDDQGGTSTIREIPFYVVPNRAPLLTVNAPVISGLINSDTFTINGTFEDSDRNTTVVSYRINGSTSVQIAEGVSGPFEFELSFGQLVIGANEIVIEAVDSYGAKVSKTIKLNKAAVETPLLKSTVRYKINPPTGSAQAVLLWIQRDEQLDIDVSLNMTMVGEAESFIALVASNTAPIDQASSIVEDEFYHEADAPKDNIIVQIDMTRSSVEVSDAIHLISGVLE